MDVGEPQKEIEVIPEHIPVPSKDPDKRPASTPAYTPKEKEVVTSNHASTGVMA